MRSLFVTRWVFIGLVHLDEDEAVGGAFFAMQIEANHTGLFATLRCIGLSGCNECVDVFGKDVNEDVNNEHHQRVARVRTLSGKRMRGELKKAGELEGTL